MSAIDKNKIFFGLIHYILSEQSNVDWILKTSLVNFTGINSTVDNKKFKRDSITDDIIDYIYTVKPYHVQFEQFIEKYSSDKDDAKVHITENNGVSMEIRYDAITSEVDAQGDMSDVEYMNTHMANRLWLFKHQDFKSIYKNDDEIKNYIKELLNCHFKGIHVDGYEFDIDKSGYDAFLYDSNLYDSPTITNDYCLIDTKENYQFPYIKKFIKVGLNSLIIDSDKPVYNSNVEIYSEYNDKKEKVENFTLKDNIITFFSPIRQYEKISIITKIDGLRRGFIFVGHPFIESDDELNKRQFVELGTNTFEIPDGDIGSKKVIVHIELPNGSRFPTTNFEKDGKNIIVYNDLKENYHVVITTIDYRQIYDKIFTYEDCYGNSNNIVTMDADKFLRPYYEAERPSELSVVYPINNYFVYTENEKGSINSLYCSDFKNNQYKMPITQTMKTKLSQDLNIGDRIIMVDNISKLIMPHTSESKEIIPGKILINSELIEFYDFEKLEKNKGILKSIRRATNGTVLLEKHEKNSDVYSYNEQTLSNYSSKSISITSEVKSNTENKFVIPGNVVDKNDVSVYVKKHIDLLSNITFIGNSFDISEDNIKLPGDVIITSETNASTVYNGQSLGITIGGVDYKVSFTKNANIDDVISAIKQVIPSIEVINDNNKIKFIATHGKTLKIYNKKGHPLQELFGEILFGTQNNFEINMDGYNGISINNFEIYWGSDKTSTSWMKSNPKKGNINDVVDAINNNELVNDLVYAYNRDGHLELILLTDKNIEISNLTDTTNPLDNLNILGIDNKIEIQKNLKMSNNLLSFYNSEPTNLGYLYVNNDKVYFKNIQRIINGNTVTYRISNYFTTKEYKAAESYILAVQPTLIDKSNYNIIDNKYVVFNDKPKLGEIITIENIR